MTKRYGSALASLMMLYPGLHAATGVVAVWDEMANPPNYLTGMDALDQSTALPGQRFGTVLNATHARINGSKKQNTRQSIDGTFGDGTDLLTLEGNPISANTVDTFGARVDAGQGSEFTFTNVSGTPCQLERFYFDWGRSTNTSPTTITCSYIGPDLQEIILLTNSDTPTTQNIDDHADFSVDLTAYTIADGESFTLRLVASNGDTGGVLDNIALSVTATIPAQPCPFPMEGTWLDTGSWMGWIDSLNAPYYYSNALSGWTYIPDLPDACATEGAWVYIYK